LLPPIRYREFSIASSPSKEQHRRNGNSQMIALELCVAVVKGKTRLGRSFHGLCSHYLSQLSEGESDVRLWIRPGSFHGLPLNPATDTTMSEPVLYVGAGTGVAPLRSLIAERDTVLYGQEKSSTTDEDERDDILVFGCRKKEADFYYEAEWAALEASGRLKLLTAFSRDQWHKVYVQQVIEKADKESKLLSRHILERSGSVYIAGGPKMARAVKDYIVESLSTELGGDDKKAQRVLTTMHLTGRFSVEAWS